MTAILSSSQSADGIPASCIETCPTDVTRSPELSPSVGPGLPLSDSAREAAIHRAGDLFLHYMAKYELTGDFQYRGQADRVLGIQRDLILGRSPEQVARMEKELGLA